MKIKSSVTTVLVIVALLLGGYVMGVSANEESAPTVAPTTATQKQADAMNIEAENRLERASLVRVVDGDTIVVNRGYGDEKVRLIGIDTPESVHPDGSKNTEQGNLASENTKVVLEDVDAVWLERDTSDTDRYGRLLRYVWLTPDTSDIMNMLNARLVADGWAVPKTYKPDTAHAEDFERIASGELS